MFYVILFKIRMHHYAFAINHLRIWSGEKDMMFFQAFRSPTKCILFGLQLLNTVINIVSDGYSKYIYNPLEEMYYDVVKDSFTHIVVYDLEHVKRRTLLQVRMDHIIMYYINRFILHIDTHDDLFFDEWVLSPEDVNVIYEVTCCKGKRFFIRPDVGDVKITCESLGVLASSNANRLQRNRFPYLYLGVCGTDMTSFFGDKNTICHKLSVTAKEMWIMAHLSGVFAARRLMNTFLMQPEQRPFILAIDKMTLDEIVYKDTQVLSL